jgi:hypothetical protein
MSVVGIVFLKPANVDAAVRPIIFVHHSTPSGGNEDPSLADIVAAARLSMPGRPSASGTLAG